MRKKERAALIVEALKEHYPASCSLVARKDYELLFATRLSAQCTDARVNVVTKELFSRWDSLEAIAGADLSELMEVVKPCGLYRVKAMDIQNAPRPCWKTMKAKCLTPWKNCSSCLAWDARRPT